MVMVHTVFGSALASDTHAAAKTVNRAANVRKRDRSKTIGRSMRPVLHGPHRRGNNL